MFRALACIGSALCLVPLTASVRQADVPWQIHAFIGTIVCLTSIRPRWGLLTLAGLLPLAPAIQVIFPGSSPTERMVLAFLAPAGIRLAADRRNITSRLLWPASLFIVVLAGSGLVQLSEAQQRSSDIAPFLAAMWRHFSGAYFTMRAEYAALNGTLVWIEAVLLAVFVDALLGREPEGRFPATRLLVLGGGAFAFFSLNRLVQIGLWHLDPLRAVSNVVLHGRFNPFFSDINAAASLYAMLLVPALWLAWRGRQPWAWGPAALLALASWLAGSRAAVAAVVLTFAFAWVIAHRPAAWKAVGAAGLLVGLVVVLMGLTGRNISAGTAFGIRADLTKVALDLTATSPVFGIGLSNFRLFSPNVIPDDMRRRHGGFLRNGENAHNNFLQILAELGVVGLVTFLLLIAPALRPAWRSRDSGSEAVALAGGLVAFLLTCLLGHPLLVDHVRAMFFLVLGMAAGADAASTTATHAGRWRTGALAAALVTIAAAQPVRLFEERRHMYLDGVVIGASDPMDPIDGVAFRVANRESTWFVSSAARAVVISLRVREGPTRRCLVEIALDGRPANIVAATSEAWAQVELQLPRGQATLQSRRFDLRVADEACTLMVGAFNVR